MEILNSGLILKTFTHLVIYLQTDKIKKVSKKYGPYGDKTCFRGFRESEVQTSLHSYKDNLEN